MSRTTIDRCPCLHTVQKIKYILRQHIIIDLHDQYTTDSQLHLALFTQPPMRWKSICFTDVFFCFGVFFVFSVCHKNTRQPFSGTAERIFMKLLPNDSGENGVCNVVPPPGESRAAAWRMANVDDLRNLCYDSGAITRGRHARRLHYKIMSARMDLI